MRSARCRGSGVETKSANAVRNPPASVSANPHSVERYMPRTTHRDRFSDKEPSPRGLASYDVNAGAAVSFSRGANYFRGRRREPEPGTTSGAREETPRSVSRRTPHLAEQACGRDYDPYSERGHANAEVCPLQPLRSTAKGMSHLSLQI
jgi:hypothetical protein